MLVRRYTGEHKPGLGRMVVMLRTGSRAGETAFACVSIQLCSGFRKLCGLVELVGRLLF